MADYRDVSQVYANEGIKAVSVLNGGAALALLTQTSELVNAKLASVYFAPMCWWTAGLVIGTLLWAFAFVSTRYVDKSTVENNASHLRTSDHWMHLTLVGFGLSVLCFAVGAVTLASSISTILIP